MPLRFEQMRACLRNFDFQNLFIDELGWDHHAQHLDVQVDGQNYALSAIAEKHGVVALHLPSATGSIPDHPTRKKIDAKVTKSLREHLIIFTDARKTEQVWQWIRREQGKPTASREHRYDKSQSGTALIQKLQGIAFSLEEEEQLNLTAVTSRTRQAFDLDRVTKRFYDKFKAEHATFLKFIKGIPEQGLQRWYASVMLNRLMFIYFIQKKKFLDGDQGYLHNKLAEIQRGGKDRYYREFLCPLFFEGFAKKAEDRSAATNRLLGTVPYLNGGLFLKHQIEELHGKAITIADAAFDKLFEFFEQYNWHLDERPLRDDNEINPDVLGYIFEKYINQKQMGAYYTKEDITDYISKNTVIPFLLERARENCKVAFEPGGALWKLLQTDPDRYIYEAVRRGVVLEDGSVFPESELPGFVQKGMRDPKARMFEKRYNLGTAEVPDKDGANLALPTETWREYIERRKRCLGLRAKLKAGEVHEINDLITFNLNIRQFMQDIIENCEGPELLRALWRAILEVSILDPTCGSGAFLFAALNILEPLYEACLDRMEGFLGDLERSGEKHRPEKFADFKTALAQIEKHPNERYFILKTIMVNNLYGVDIMEEAIEICKLRLFLKLVAQVDDPAKIEPLPDIDFNIRAGNTLVGYARLEDLRKTLQRKNELADFAEDDLQRIEEKAEDIEALFKLFRKAQTSERDLSEPEAKETLKARLKDLDDELNRYLAAEYGVDAKKKGAYAAWLDSHKPFHWFVEFFGIMKRGGFDVIIGNPPFVENTSGKVGYTIQRHSYTTIDCGNLYAFVSERSMRLLVQWGASSLIMPSASICTPRMSRLAATIRERFQMVWTTVWDERPSKLFDGVDQQLAIHIGHSTGPAAQVAGASMRHWTTEERESLFATLSYTTLSPSQRVAYVSPKIGSPIETFILSKIFAITHVISSTLMIGDTKVFYRNAGGRYWRLVKTFPTYFRSDAGAKTTSTEKTFLVNKDYASVFVALFSSSFFYWYWRVCSNCRHLTDRELGSFPVAKSIFGKAASQELKTLAGRFEDCLKETKKRQATDNKQSGTVVQDVFYVSNAKPIIDQIDQVLAKHYGFTDEELDFIINYDIKYRMGRDSCGDEDCEP